MKTKTTLNVFLIGCELFLFACGSQYVESYNQMPNLAIASALVDIRVSEITKRQYVNTTYHLGTSWRSITKLILTTSEKEFLTDLVRKTVLIIQKNNNIPIIRSMPSDNSEIRELLGDTSFNDGNFIPKAFRKNEENFTVTSLGYQSRSSIMAICKDLNVDTLLWVKNYPKINIESLKPTKILGSLLSTDWMKGKIRVNGHVSVLHADLTKIRDEKFISHITMENYYYVPHPFHYINYDSKDQIVKLCNYLNVDALLFLQFKFQLIRVPVSIGGKYRIKLKGTISVVGKNGKKVREETIWGKSSYITIPYENQGTGQADYFVIEKTLDSLDNSDYSEPTIEYLIVEPYGRTRYSFSLENVYASLFKEAVEDFKFNLKKQSLEKNALFRKE